MQPGDQVIRYAELEGTSIARSAVGSGPPLVIGGWWSSHLELDWRNTGFRRFVAALAEHRTVIRYDRSGAGVSDRGVMPARSLEEDLATLEALVDAAAPGPGPIALFGASSGVGVASLFAARHPERVDGLVLYATYARGAELAPAAARETMLSILPDATAEERDEFVEFQRRTASRAVALASLRAVYEFDATGHLGDVLAPTFVLHRRADRAIRSRSARTWRATSATPASSRSRATTTTRGVATPAPSRVRRSRSSGCPSRSSNRARRVDQVRASGRCGTAHRARAGGAAVRRPRRNRRRDRRASRAVDAHGALTHREHPHQARVPSRTAAAAWALRNELIWCRARRSRLICSSERSDAPSWRFRP